MKTKLVKKRFILFGLYLVMTFLIAHPGWGQSKPQTHSPIITHIYAADKGPFGMIWRIYIEAEGVAADMNYIIVVVDQAGQGHYPPDRILLDPQHRNHLKGFLQWNTLSSKGAGLEEGTQITLKISIIDKLGNESKEAILPFTFVSGVRNPEGLPAPFAGENIPRIGYIDINLVNPDQG